MATTLVIKSADFSVNKLTTVTLDEQTQCTGISLDHSTLDVIYGETGTLVATATPSDTTDTISWESSDLTIATVSNGVITPVGVGTATITVTCGNYSATCAVTCKAFMDTDDVTKRVGYFMSGNDLAGGGNGLPTWTSTSSNVGGFHSDNGNLHFYNLADIYPYALPVNTSRIQVTIANGSNIDRMDVVEWFNSNTRPSSSSSYAEVAGLLIKQGYSAFTPTTDASGNTVYVLNVPTNTPSIDMFTITFYSSVTMTSEMLNDVTIEFLPAA